MCVTYELQNNSSPILFVYDFIILAIGSENMWKEFIIIILGKVSQGLESYIL